jgi:hypothetical protein
MERINPNRSAVCLEQPTLPIGTAVRPRSVPYALECSSMLGRIAHSVAGWAGYYLVRIDQPAEHVAFGRAAYLDMLRRVATDLEVAA